MSEPKHDCAFTVENDYFRFRAGGLLLKDGKILFVKTNFGDYCYVAGGGVKIGESTETGVLREFTEEVGIQVKIERLAVVCENFFKGHGGNIEGKDCHTLEFYYLLSTEEDISKIPAKTDEDEELVWIPVEKIPESNIKPNFIKTKINEILNQRAPLHIIEDTDRNN